LGKDFARGDLEMIVEVLDRSLVGIKLRRQESVHLFCVLCTFCVHAAHRQWDSDRLWDKFGTNLL
jgi:hypothetical protein